ncbi:MAG: hypothetical protein ACKOSQ_00360, partial [Planctomycetaceae bacterium]
TSLPRDVHRVAFAPDGSPWFIADAPARPPDPAAFRRQVEAATGWQAPWVSGGDILLLDRRGRVWCRSDAEPGVLLGYDPATRRWIERAARRVGAARDWVCKPVAHESRLGRIYVADGPGVHVLDGDSWTFHDLSRENVERRFFHDGNEQFNPVEFTEDAAGRVYAWCIWDRYGWTGTVGCFVHDGRWRQLRVHARTPDEAGLVEQAAAGKKIGADLATRFGVTAVVPLANDKVVLLARGGAARLARLPRGDEESACAAGDDPDQPPRIDGHMLTRCHVVLREPGGAAWVWAAAAETPDGVSVDGAVWRIDGEGHVAPAPLGIQGWSRSGYPDSAIVARNGRVYAACFNAGCATVDGRRPVRVTGLGEESLRWLLGEDRDGRIYLSDGARVHAFHPDWPETRLGLEAVPARIPRGEQQVCLDARGRVWAQVRPAAGGPPTLAVHDDGWRPESPRDAEPGPIVFLQPLRDGKLVVQWRAAGAAHYHDGAVWHSHPSLVDLVDKRHAELVRAIDNTRPGRDFYAALRVDQAGRIWVREWTKLHVHDGRELIALTATCRRPNVRWEFLWPLPDGRGMLLGGTSPDGGGKAAVVDRGDDAWQAADRILPGVLRSDYTTRSGLRIDSRGRLWLPRDGTSAGLCDERAERVVEETGFPRFEDGAGRIWFARTAPGTSPLHGEIDALVVMDAAGKTARVAVPPAATTARIAEARPGSVWLVTNEGLLHLRVADGADGPRVEVAAHYTRGVPRGSLLDAFVDRAGTLWCYGPGETDYRLWSVSLPKPDAAP